MRGKRAGVCWPGPSSLPLLAKGLLTVSLSPERGGRTREEEKEEQVLGFGAGLGPHPSSFILLLLSVSFSTNQISIYSEPSMHSSLALLQRI